MAARYSTYGMLQPAKKAGKPREILSCENTNVSVCITVLLLIVNRRLRLFQGKVPPACTTANDTVRGWFQPNPVAQNPETFQSPRCCVPKSLFAALVFY